jgi:hypothetical protein
MNGSNGRELFPVKRQAFAKDSMYATPRKVAKDYNEWTPTTVRARAKELKDWVVHRWPY